MAFCQGPVSFTMTLRNFLSAMLQGIESAVAEMYNTSTRFRMNTTLHKLWVRIRPSSVMRVISYDMIRAGHDMI